MTIRDDIEIQDDVVTEIRWSPDVEGGEIKVVVDDGIVTLTGSVGSLRDKDRAERAAKRITGVAGIANDIEVRGATDDNPSDTQIAHEAIAAIRADLPDATAHVQILARDGHVSLEGVVEWQWQRQRIESTVRAIKGIAVVSNLLTIRPGVVATDIKRDIEKAFNRSAEVDARHITVLAHSGEVTLRGTVRSLSERDEALRTAWSAPGVTNVTNQIAVRR
jgi:osmotically-inducible protein OsmY